MTDIDFDAARRYADRDIVAQGEYYIAHIAAMTAEGLHKKSDIAAELAHRDIALAVAEQRIRRYDCGGGISGCRNVSERCVRCERDLLRERIELERERDDARDLNAINKTTER